MTMCLILFSYENHPDYRLILAANRDEYYNRPTSPIAFWDDMPQILAGRDLKHSGTWLGITKTGKIAAITNFRDPASIKEKAPSRGFLVSDFLSGDESPRHYLKRIKKTGYKYNGFNLLVGNNYELFYYSNLNKDIKKIKPGLYGVSNHLLDTSWPKVEKGKSELKTLLAGNNRLNSEDIFSILKDRSRPPDDKLPDTGVDLDWERLLSSLFIAGKRYGTRSSSIVLVTKDKKIIFKERTFIPEGADTIKYYTKNYELNLAQTI